jgi:hypothetical protein
MATPKLTARQNNWVMHFTNADPSAGTFMNATRAAQEAGYTGNYQSCANAGLANIRNPKVMMAVDELMAAQFDASKITIDKVLIDLECTRLLAIRSGQLNVARQCSRDMGQYLKMFVDRIELVQTVEESSTEDLAALLGDVLKKIDDTSIVEIIKGPSGTVTREGGVIPVKRNKAANRD